MLFDVYGLDKIWKKDIKCTFERESGQHTVKIVETNAPKIFRLVGTRVYMI